MKEFDHPHVAKLVGEPLLGGGRYKTGLKLCFPKVGGQPVEEKFGLPGEQADDNITRWVLAEI